MDDVDVIIQQHFTVILVKAAVIRHGLLQTVGAINIDQRAQRDPRQKPEGVNVAAVNRPAPMMAALSVVMSPPVMCGHSPAFALSRIALRL